MAIGNFRDAVSRAVAAPSRPRSYLAALEAALRVATCGSEKPQLFIVGPPRSGTTLIYQYIVHRLRVAYFTNGVGRFPGAPCVTTWAQRFFHGEYVSDFSSEYGKVKGPVAPREAGAFWNRYFDPEAYQQENSLTPEMVERLRRTIACVQKAFGESPFVNKNVKHLLRLKVLRDIFPESVFLIVERDLPDAALSMLRARRALFGDPSRWFSIRPLDFEALSSLAPVDQVIGQYRSVIRKMEDDLQDFPPDRYLRVSYKDFCLRPEALIDRIVEYLGPLEYRNPAVESFPVLKNYPQTEEEHELVTKTNGQ